MTLYDIMKERHKQKGDFDEVQEEICNDDDGCTV